MSYGYAVVEINQASHQAEWVVSDVEWSRQDAEYTAELYREKTAAVGRGERYAVVELIEVDDDD